MSKILIITDAWKPQVNGVVTVIENIKIELEKKWHIVNLITPEDFVNFPCPTYKEIKLSIATTWKMKKKINNFDADFIHIATEWPIWMAWRQVCKENKYKFTSAFHTRFHEYINYRTGISASLILELMRLFHRRSQSVLVTTESQKNELLENGFKNVEIYPLGIKWDIWNFSWNNPISDLKWPIFTYLWRVAIEKNIEEFLNVEIKWTKIVIWDWPQKEKLEKKYPEVKFLWYKSGEELSDILSCSDVYVFPSLTDTFGLTIIEAMKCWLPVAAFNVQGPKDIITNWFDWFVGDNLKENMENCLKIDRKNPKKTAKKYTWEKASEKFLEYQIRAK